MMDIELYEVLKRHIHEEAARMIAERFRDPNELATKADLELTAGALRTDMGALRTELKTDMADLRTELREGLANIRAEMRELHVSSVRWMVGSFIPLWLGVVGIVITLLVKF